MRLGFWSTERGPQNLERQHRKTEICVYTAIQEHISGYSSALNCGPRALSNHYSVCYSQPTCLHMSDFCKSDTVRHAQLMPAFSLTICNIRLSFKITSSPSSAWRTPAAWPCLKAIRYRPLRPVACLKLSRQIVLLVKYRAKLHDPESFALFVKAANHRLSIVLNLVGPYPCVSKQCVDASSLSCSLAVISSAVNPTLYSLDPRFALLACPTQSTICHSFEFP